MPDATMGTGTIAVIAMSGAIDTRDATITAAETIRGQSSAGSLLEPSSVESLLISGEQAACLTTCNGAQTGTARIVHMTTLTCPAQV